MKRLILILALIGLLVVGCDSGGDTPTATVTPTITPSETPVATEEPTPSQDTPTPSPTSALTPTATPTLSPTPTSTLTPTATPELTLEIVSVTSPIGKGNTATLKAKTQPGAYCTITVYYKSGPSEASGLNGKTADSSGNVSWSWKVGTRTTPGSWRVVVQASMDGETISKTEYFTVQ